MELRFVKTNPTENMTILVESAVTREQQPRVAATLTAYSGVYAEQAGFIERPQNRTAWARLQMAGGEFCGNAAMSLAALLAWDRGLPAGEVAEVPLEVSGAAGIVHCRVELCEGYALATVSLPPPSKIERRELVLSAGALTATAVQLGGITHLILPVQAVDSGWRAVAEQFAQAPPSWLENDAVGVLLYDEAHARIDPVVAVRGCGAAVWERGCGSGTAALGAYLAQRRLGDVNAAVHQPGGTISVQAQWGDGSVTRIAITGQVRLVARGTAYLPADAAAF